MPKDNPIAKYIPKGNPITKYITGGNTSSGPVRAVQNYQERLKLAGVPDEVAAVRSDDRNIIERLLNTPRNTGFLGDILDLLSRGNYASANVFKEATDNKTSNVMDVLKAAGRGLAGIDRTTYSDVLGEAGVQEGLGRSAAGFGLDVALDPTTYLTLGASAAGKTAAKFAGKAIPGTEKAIGGISAAIKPVREAIAATETGKTLGKTFKGFRFRPAGVSEEEFKPFVDRIEQFRKEYSVNPERAVQQAIEEGKKFTPEEQALAGKLRETPGKKVAYRGVDDLKRGREVRAYSEAGAAVNKQLLDEAKGVGLKVDELEDYLAHVPGREQNVIKRQTLGGKTGPLKAYDPNARARTIEGTVEEINKRIGGEFFEQRMPIADAVRNARMERAIATQKFLNDVVANSDWAIPLKGKQKPPVGYKIWEPQGPFRFYPTETGVAVTKDVPRYAVPEYVGEYLDEAMKTFRDDKASEGLKRMYMNAQRLWTMSVTGLNPGYHSRNIQGNIFNSWLAGMKSPRPIADAVSIALGREGETSSGILYTAIQKEFEAEGLAASNFFSQNSDILERVRREMGEGRKGVMETVREVSSKIEGNSKLALFIDQRNKGKSAKEAADVVRKYLFDYQDLTPTEQKIKAVLPFLTWSRKNIPLQIESMVTQPGKYAATEKGFNAIEGLSSATVAEEDLPEWFKEEHAIRTPFKNEKGDQLYWMPNLPLVDVNTLGPRDLYSRVSPLIKAGPELLANQNISLDRPIERFKGQTVEYPGGFRVPAKLDYLINQFGVARNVGNVASTVQGANGAKSTLELLLNLIGISNYPINPEKAETSKAYEQRQEYQDLLKRLREQGTEVPTLTEAKGGNPVAKYIR